MLGPPKQMGPQAQALQQGTVPAGQVSSPSPPSVQHWFDRQSANFACFSCQFVVTDDQDYKAHFTDPDTLVNWDCVQQVVSGDDISRTFDLI